MRTSNLDSILSVLCILILLGLLIFAMLDISKEKDEESVEVTYKVEILNDSTATLTSKEEVLTLHFKSAMSLKSDSVTFIWK